MTPLLTSVKSRETAERQIVTSSQCHRAAGPRGPTAGRKHRYGKRRSFGRASALLQRAIITTLDAGARCELLRWDGFCQPRVPCRRAGRLARLERERRCDDLRSAWLRIRRRAHTQPAARAPGARISRAPTPSTRTLTTRARTPRARTPRARTSRARTSRARTSRARTSRAPPPGALPKAQPSRVLPGKPPRAPPSARTRRTPAPRARTPRASLRARTPRVPPRAAEPGRRECRRGHRPEPGR